MKTFLNKETRSMRKTIGTTFSNPRLTAGALIAAAALALVLVPALPVFAGDQETGPNISGEMTGMERKQQLQEQRQSEAYRIVVPPGPDGTPQRPVRGLSRTEKAEMDDLEFRYQMGQIGEAEYIQRRNEMMQRIGLEPEF